MPTVTDVIDVYLSLKHTLWVLPGGKKKKIRDEPCWFRHTVMKAGLPAFMTNKIFWSVLHLDIEVHVLTRRFKRDTICDTAPFEHPEF